MNYINCLDRETIEQTMVREKYTRTEKEKNRPSERQKYRQTGILRTRELIENRLTDNLDKIRQKLTKKRDS